MYIIHSSGLIICNQDVSLLPNMGGAMLLSHKLGL